MEVKGIISDSPTNMNSMVCNSVKEAVEHCKRNATNRGFTFQYAVNPDTLELIEVMKSGKIAQKDIKELFAQGFTIWVYSWCWCPKKFLVGDAIVGISKTIDLTDRHHVGQWLKAMS